MTQCVAGFGAAHGNDLCVCLSDPCGCPELAIQGREGSVSARQARKARRATRTDRSARSRRRVKFFTFCDPRRRCALPGVFFAMVHWQFGNFRAARSKGRPCGSGKDIEPRGPESLSARNRYRSRSVNGGAVRDIDSIRWEPVRRERLWRKSRSWRPRECH